jgi:hypothetical protein
VSKYKYEKRKGQKNKKAILISLPHGLSRSILAGPWRANGGADRVRAAHIIMWRPVAAARPPHLRRRSCCASPAPHHPPTAGEPPPQSASSRHPPLHGPTTTGCPAVPLRSGCARFAAIWHLWPGSVSYCRAALQHIFSTVSALQMSCRVVDGLKSFLRPDTLSTVTPFLQNEPE